MILDKTSGKLFYIYDETIYPHGKHIRISEFNPELSLNQFTTRTDSVPDTGIVDLGFHYGVKIKGDVNGSGTITVGDAQTAFFIALEMYEPTDEELWAADINNSKRVTVGDAQTIFYIALELL